MDNSQGIDGLQSRMIKIIDTGVDHDTRKQYRTKGPPPSYVPSEFLSYSTDNQLDLFFEHEGHQPSRLLSYN